MSAVADRPIAPKKKRGRGAAPPPGDPVTRYARAVLDGTPLMFRDQEFSSLSGRAVRLACERHLKDLARQRTADFPYYFDVGAAEHVINFFPAFLTLETGAPFHLPPWLEFCYGSIYGWKCWDGTNAKGKVVVELDAEFLKRANYRKYQHGFFESSKGSGKTPSAGGLGLYGAAYDDEPHAEIYSTGFDKGQASIILNDAIRMGENSPDDDFRAEFEIDKYNIAHPSSGSFFRAMSSQHQSKSGPRPHYVLSDEIHEHRDGTVVTKAESGFKNRAQPLGLKYTNSGSNKTSYCWQLHQKSINVLEGVIVDEQWFAYVCHLDPCDQCYSDGFRQPKDGCPDCDDWTDPAVWPKISPALGIVVQPKYLQDAVDAALSLPSEYNLKRRLNFCIWTETHNSWITSEKWATCKVDKVSEDNASLHACAAGLDPSSIHDLTSLVVAIRHEDPPGTKSVEEVTIEGLDEHGQRIQEVYRMNFHVELVPFFWLPKDTLNERVQKERVPYDVWARTPSIEKPYIITTPGPSIDHDAIYDFIIGNKEKPTEKPGAWKQFRIQTLGMDENSGRYLFKKLQTEGRLGDKIVAVGQGWKLSEALKFIEVLIAHRRLWHDGNPVLGLCFANAEPERNTRTGGLAIVKPSDEKCIDGAVATAMAIKELMALPGKRGPKKPVMFFMGGR